VRVLSNSLGSDQQCWSFAGCGGGEWYLYVSQHPLRCFKCSAQFSALTDQKPPKLVQASH